MSAGQGAPSDMVVVIRTDVEPWQMPSGVRFGCCTASQLSAGNRLKPKRYVQKHSGSPQGVRIPSYGSLEFSALSDRWISGTGPTRLDSNFYGRIHGLCHGLGGQSLSGRRSPRRPLILIQDLH